MHPDKGRLVPVGLPFGPKCRMVFMNVNQRAFVTDSPQVRSLVTPFFRLEKGPLWSRARHLPRPATIITVPLPWHRGRDSCLHFFAVTLAVACGPPSSPVALNTSLSAASRPRGNQGFPCLKVSLKISVAPLPCGYYKPDMDKTIRKYDSFAAVKDDEYREWQALPVQARLDAAAELSFMQFQWKEPTRDVQSGLQRILVRVQRAPR